MKRLSMRKLVYAMMATVACLILIGCEPPVLRVLPFQIISDHYAFHSIHGYEEPELIVMASEAQVVPPNPDLEFLTQSAKDQIAQLDFQNSFAVLIRHGRSPLSARTKVIWREGDTVILSTTEDTIVGNYIMVGYTFPFELLSVSKLGSWQREIQFILQRDKQGIRRRLSHYIP